jgi:hypothetical protein
MNLRTVLILKLKEKKVTLFWISEIFCNKRKNCICQPLKLRGLSEFKETGVNTAELFLPESASFKVGIAILNILRTMDVEGKVQELMSTNFLILFAIRTNNHSTNMIRKFT